jgi:hypothetical protein
MGDVVSASLTKSELFLLSEMHSEQLPLHSIIAVLVVVGSDGVGDER